MTTSLQQQQQLKSVSPTAKTTSWQQPFFFQWLSKKSRVVMKFDLYGTSMIYPGDSFTVDIVLFFSSKLL